MKDPNDIKIDDIPTTMEELKAYEAKFGTQSMQEAADTTGSEEEIKAAMQKQREAFLAKVPSDEEMKEQVIEQLKSIYDPELPVNIYDLGLIYDIDCWTDEVSGLKKCKVTMTLTSATCSMSEVIVDLVKSIPARLEYLENLDVELVFDPPWNQEKMSDEAKLTMGLL
jgi:metal-sulfur cluster biosynthetic enzyme